MYLSNYYQVSTDFETYNASMMIIDAISIPISALMVVASCFLFKKAGLAFWKALIPGYNLYLYYKMCGVNPLYLLTYVFLVMGSIIGTVQCIVKESPWPMLWWLAPFIIAQFIVEVMLANGLSKRFGHGIGYTLGLLFMNVVFIPLLAFGKSVYRRLDSDEPLVKATSENSESSENSENSENSESSDTSKSSDSSEESN